MVYNKKNESLLWAISIIYHGKNKLHFDIHTTAVLPPSNAYTNSTENIQYVYIFVFDGYQEH